MDLKSILGGLAFALMWSSAFTSARIIVADAPPLMALSLRFLISGLIALAIAFLLGQTWKLTRSQWMLTLVFGICQNSLYLGLNFVAMQTVEASMASIIASTMPLAVALIGWVVLRDRIRPLGTLGLIVGMVGVAIIMVPRVTQGGDLFGIALCFVGMLALAIATLVLRGASSGGNMMMIVGLQMLVGSASLSVIAVVTETWVVDWNTPFVIAFLYTTLVPGLIATLVWFWLVNRIGMVKAATFHFLNPVFGVAIAAVLLGETLGLTDIIGVIIVGLGILAVQLSKQPSR